MVGPERPDPDSVHMRGKNRKPRVSRRELGQAQVESALTLPLALFMILGAIQLFMIQNARVMAEYAAFRAARAGSVNHANCTAMLHSALAAVLPAVRATNGIRPLGEAFEAVKDNTFGSGYEMSNGLDVGNEDVVWIYRDSPRLSDISGDEDSDFDYLREGEDPLQIKISLVFWYPMRIPFADWILFRTAMAGMGIQEHVGNNPLMPTAETTWERGSVPEYITRFSEVRSKMSEHLNGRRYLLPIQTSYTMRMMTPAKRRHLANLKCE